MFEKVTPGCIPVGTHTEFGHIEAVSLTAYYIRPAAWDRKYDGFGTACWVPFAAVHGTPAPAEPLVVFG